METLIKIDIQQIIIIAMFFANLIYYKFKIEKLEKDIEELNNTIRQLLAITKFLEKENEHLAKIIRGKEK